MTKLAQAVWPKREPGHAWRKLERDKAAQQDCGAARVAAEFIALPLVPPAPVSLQDIRIELRRSATT